MLDGVKDIQICRLTSADVVRHALVQQIINAYEKADKKREQEQSLRQEQRRAFYRREDDAQKEYQPNKRLSGTYKRKK